MSPSIHIWALDRVGRGSGSKTLSKLSLTFTKAVVPCRATHVMHGVRPLEITRGHHVCQLMLGKPNLMRRTRWGLSADKAIKSAEQAVP